MDFTKMSRCRTLKHMIQAIAFDVDGTLVKTDRLFFETMQTVAERYGRRVPERLLNTLIGASGEEARRTFYNIANIPISYEAFHNELRTEFMTVLEGDVPSVTGFKQLMTALRKKGIPFGVVTSGLKENLFKKKPIRDIQSMLHFAIAFEDVKNAKPHPEPYLQAAARANVRPDNMLVFEDSISGITAAHAAKCKVIAIDTKNGKPAHHLCNLVIRDYQDPKLESFLVTNLFD